jgi:hypothetical protein
LREVRGKPFQLVGHALAVLVRRRHRRKVHHR